VKPVKIYTTSWCPYCVQAKKLLDQRGVRYEEIDCEGDDDLRAWLVKETGRRTVPQIFIGEEAIGGFTDLAALDKSGGLKTKLEA
jgi:glutaredoxin 3